MLFNTWKKHTIKVLSKLGLILQDVRIYKLDTDIWWTEDTLASTVQVILPEHQQLQHYHSTLSGFNISCKLSFKETLNTPSVPRTYKIAGVIKHIK